jgi:hypothetical protein
VEEVIETSFLKPSKKLVENLGFSLQAESTKESFLGAFLMLTFGLGL